MESDGGKSTAEDGIEEKLVGEGEATSDKEDADKEKERGKYSSEVRNGETKMECDMRRAFVGMGKEELMKFANDPFWVLTRKLLFVLFWVMWAAMLAGSIVIVIYSPKCTSGAADESASAAGVVYRFDLRAFEHGSLHSRIGHLKALKDHLPYLEELGVDSLLVNNLMEAVDNDRDTVKDFDEIDSSYGSFEILKDLTQRMEKKNMRLTMSFDPNYSSDRHEWFRNSLAKIDPFTDYYVWARGSYSSEDDAQVPPNNWHSVTGGSAWTYVKERHQFYLHQFASHRPDLNYRTSAVTDGVRQVLLSWLDRGLHGLHLVNTKYLVEDESMGNETVDPSPGAVHDDYAFYSHSRTTYQPLTLDILREWSEAVRSRDSVLYLSDFNSPELDSHLVVYHAMKLSDSVNATEFDHSVRTNLNRKNPTWLWECKDACPDEPTSKGLLAVFLALPGTAVINGGEELPWIAGKPWTSTVTNNTLPNEFEYYLSTIHSERADPNSFLNALKKLISLRKEDAFKFGLTRHMVLNGTVFALTRSDGEDSYLVAFNFDDGERTVSFSRFPDMTSDSSLHLVHASRAVDSQLEETGPYVTIDAKTLLVFKYKSSLSDTVTAS